MIKIFVVEDEKDIANLVTYNLEKEGYKTKAFQTGEEALQNIKTFKPDMVILDLMLPGMQGIDVLRYIKEDFNLKTVPVVIISAKSSETDKVLGLEMGADDYLIKPFSVKELISRVKAVFRRLMPANVPSLLECGDLSINFDSIKVKVRDKEVHLSPYEYKILAFLAQHPGKTFSRDTLLNQVWQTDAFVLPRTVDVHIRKIRTIIEKNPRQPKYIKTVRGFGYLFDAGK